MTSKIRAGRLDRELTAAGRGSDRALDPELEAEISAVADWFEALPLDLRAYLDREAKAGREGYPWP